MKLYVNALPVATALRVWDLMLAEQNDGGQPTELLVRVGLAALAEHETVLRKVRDSEVFADELHKACAETADAERLIDRVCSRRWVRVVAEEQRSALQQLRPAQPEPEPELEPEPEPEPEPELEPEPRAGSRDRSRTLSAVKTVLRPLRPAEEDGAPPASLFVVVCQNANVRKKKSQTSASCGVIREGTVLAARREAYNFDGRLRVQFEYEAPSGQAALGWVSVTSKAGRVLLRRCATWNPMRNLVLERTRSPMICSYWCCARVVVYAGHALKRSIATLEVGVTIDGLERRPLPSKSGLLGLLSSGGPDLSARAFAVRFELPDRRMGWACTHDSASGQLQMLETQTRAGAEDPELHEEMLEAGEWRCTKDGGPPPPPKQQQQKRCLDEIASLEADLRAHALALRADESPKTDQLGLREQLAAWKGAMHNLEAEIVKETWEKMAEDEKQRKAAMEKLQKQAEFALAEFGGSDPRYREIAAKLRATAREDEPKATTEEERAEPEVAEERGQAAESPSAWSSAEWSFQGAEEAEPPFDAWGRPRGHSDYAVNPEVALLENSDGDSSESGSEFESESEETTDSDGWSSEDSEGGAQ